MKETLQRYSIRKLSIGAASVLVGLTFFGVNANSVQAAENANGTDQTNNANTTDKGSVNAEKGAIVQHINAPKSSKDNLADNQQISVAKAGDNSQTNAENKTEKEQTNATDSDLEKANENAKQIAQKELGSDAKINDASSKEQDIYYQDSQTGKDLALANKQTGSIVSYNKKATATINYKDETIGKTLETDTVNGLLGADLNHDNSQKINDYIKAGYELDQNSVKGAYYKDQNNQFDVTLKHGTRQINAFNFKGSQSVHFVDENGKDLITPNVQQIDLIRSADTQDKVTSQIIKKGAWNYDKYTFENVTAPVINGYIAEKGSVAGSTITPEDNLVQTNIVYHKIGQIIAQDQQGKTLAKINLNNDPKDATKASATDAPKVDGYTPMMKVAVPSDPLANISIVYKKNASATVQYIDTETGKILSQKHLKGFVGDKFNYNPLEDITNYMTDGYFLMNKGYHQDKIFEDGNKIYKIEFTHAKIYYGQYRQGKAGNPIDWNNPNGAKIPAEAENTEKETTRNIDFVYKDDSGQIIKTDKNAVVQHITWYRDVGVDKVTGKVISIDPWEPEQTNYDDYQVTAKDGFVADKAVVIGTKATGDTQTAQVVYTKIGNMVPVDEKGTPIGKSVAYLADPQDPTKVLSKQNTPDIYGYEPKNLTITPQSATKDTQIIYSKMPDKTLIGKQIVHILNADGQKIHDDYVQTYTFTGAPDFTYRKDNKKVIGKWHEASHTFDNTKLPVIDGYIAPDVSALGQNVTVADPIKEINVQYQKIGQIVPIDKTGREIKGSAISYVNDPQDPTKVLPNETAPVVEGLYPEPDQATITPEDPTLDTTVVYKQKFTEHVAYIDDTSNVTIRTDDITGLDEDSANYDLKSKTADLIEKHYVLAGNNFPKDGIVFSNADAGKTYYVHVVHATAPAKVTKTVTRTIKYVNDSTEKEVASEVVQSLTFTGLGTTDLVTGKYVKVDDSGHILGNADLTWSEAQTAPLVKSPEIANIHVVRADKDADNELNGEINVLAHTFNHDDSDYTVTVHYVDDARHEENARNVTAVQTVKYVDEHGNTIHADTTNKFDFVRTPNIIDDFTDKTIIEGNWNSENHTFDNIKVPVIDGYVASQTSINGATVTPDDSARTVTIVYHSLGHFIPVHLDRKTPIAGAKSNIYINDPNDPTKVLPNEKVPAVEGYTPELDTMTPDLPTSDTIAVYRQNLTDHINYIDDTTHKTLRSDPLSGLEGKIGIYQTKALIDQYIKEGYDLVSDGWPKGVYHFDPAKTSFDIHLREGQDIVPGDVNTITETIHYVDANKKELAKSNVQTVTFHQAENLKNRVTGAIITPGKWDKESFKFTDINNPVINGYITGQAVQAAQTVTHASNKQIDIYVTYDQLGSIIPIDSKGNFVPYAPTAIYQNDPKDPTKAIATKGPEIDGFVPDDAEITPKDPREDTKATYRQKIAVTITYVNDIDGKVLDTQTINGLEGKEGVLDTKPEITKLNEANYEFVSDNFPVYGYTFSNNQTHFVVHMTEAYTSLPDKIQEATRTITINMPDGSTKTQVQSHNFITTGIKKSKVTGKIIDEGTLAESSAQLLQYNVPVIAGMHADKSALSAVTVVPGQKLTAEITYKQNGHIIAVDENNNPIKGLDPVSFTTDPKDAAKVLSVQNLPTFAGYTTKNQTITVTDPDKDIKVVYDKTAAPAEANVPTKPIIRSNEVDAKSAESSADKSDANTSTKLTTENVQNLTVNAFNTMLLQNLAVRQQTVNKHNILPASYLGSKLALKDNSRDNIKDDSNQVHHNALVFYAIVQNGHVVKLDLTQEQAHSMFNNVPTPVIHSWHLAKGQDNVTQGQSFDLSSPDKVKLVVKYDHDTYSLVNKHSQRAYRTIHLLNQKSQQVGKDIIQQDVFNYSGDLQDDQTGEIVKRGTWDKNQIIFDRLNLPVIDGYVTQNLKTDGDIATPNAYGISENVLYLPLGKFHIVNNHGQTIANDVPYQNDDRDPRKAAISQMPSVTGYIPATPSLSPTDPIKDTTIVYGSNGISGSIQVATNPSANTDWNFEPEYADNTRLDYDHDSANADNNLLLASKTTANNSNIHSSVNAFQTSHVLAEDAISNTPKSSFKHHNVKMDNLISVAQKCHTSDVNHASSNSQLASNKDSVKMQIHAKNHYEKLASLEKANKLVKLAVMHHSGYAQANAKLPQTNQSQLDALIASGIALISTSLMLYKKQKH